jgi:[ribosomal protein S5]-alanine N-acetyltransferase
LIIETARLVLREIDEGDLEDLLAIYNDSQARQYEQSGETVYSPEDIRQRISWTVADQQETPRTRFRLAVTVRPVRRLAGWVSLQPMAREIREWEIGWSLRRELWDQGFATEGARVMMQFAFVQLGAHRLVAFCHNENAASERVMQKLGMQYEGRTRGTRWLNDRWTDELIYSILEQDYEAAR